MIDNRFRHFLQSYVDPLLKIYRFIGLSPNGVTVLGCILGILAAGIAAKNHFLPAIALWWIGRLLDGTDGIYARHLRQSSEFGAFLDINCDMLAYSSMILAFLTLWPELYIVWGLILFFYILCITGALSLGNLLGEEAKTRPSNRKLHLAAGLAEGGETGIFYTCCLLFPNLVKPFSIVWLFILCITVVSRFFIAHRSLNKKVKK